jgi:hypothetical protein
VGLKLNGNTFSADLSQLQARVGACASDQVLQSVSQAGSPACVGDHAYFNQGSPGGLGDTATINVPAGAWVVLAEDTIAAHAADDVICSIELNGNPSTVIGSATQYLFQPGQGNEVTPFAIGETTTGSSSTPIVVVCNAPGTTLDASSGASIVAIPVAALN